MDDIQIAYNAKILPIKDIAGKIGIEEKYLELYGNYKAKINCSIREKYNIRAKKILITSMNPTPAGEGKTTIAIGINDALNRIGKKSIVTLREPSLGPVFGMKGGATGGGYAQVIPMEDINLHFTGDIHAVSSAHNLLSALLDNYYTRDQSICFGPDDILWHRVIDMNDRALRDIVIGLGKTNGQIRQSKFDITASSEIMAILGLANNIDDLKKRLNNIIVAISRKNEPIYSKILNAADAMAILLKHAIKPNIVQTLEHNSAIIHAGPFANIAHGTNSVIAIDIASRLADYVVIEAGFGSDLGAEKFLDIVSRQPNMSAPNVVVIVATTRAIKYHGGSKLKNIKKKDEKAIIKGFENLQKHIENMQFFNIPVIVAINKFKDDYTEELNLIEKLVKDLNVNVIKVESWEYGSKGALDIANMIVDISNKPIGNIKYVYDMNDDIETKLYKVSRTIYGANNVIITRKMKNKIKMIKEWGYNNLPICIAKTQKSLSDNSKLLGRPRDFNIEVSNIRVDAGAGFIVIYTGDILTMPGLPSKPSAINMKIDSKGNISGLF